MASKHKWRKTIYGPFVARYRCLHCDAVKIVEMPGNYRPDNTRWKVAGEEVYSEPECSE